MRTHLFFFLLFPFFVLNEGKTLHLTSQSKRIFNSRSRFCNLGPSVIRTECELMEMLVWIFNKLSLSILIQSRKLRIKCSKELPSRKIDASLAETRPAQCSPTKSRMTTPHSSIWLHLRAAEVLIMGHSQKHWSLLRTGHRTANTERSICI